MQQAATKDSYEKKKQKMTLISLSKNEFPLIKHVGYILYILYDMSPEGRYDSVTNSLNKAVDIHNRQLCSPPVYVYLYT